MPVNLMPFTSTSETCAHVPRETASKDRPEIVYCL